MTPLTDVGSLAIDFGPDFDPVLRCCCCCFVFVMYNIDVVISFYVGPVLLLYVYVVSMFGLLYCDCLYA